MRPSAPQSDSASSSSSSSSLSKFMMHDSQGQPLFFVASPPCCRHRHSVELDQIRLFPRAINWRPGSHMAINWTTGCHRGASHRSASCRRSGHKVINFGFQCIHHVRPSNDECDPHTLERALVAHPVTDCLLHVCPEAMGRESLGCTPGD